MTLRFSSCFDNPSKLLVSRGNVSQFRTTLSSWQTRLLKWTFWCPHCFTLSDNLGQLSFPHSLSLSLAQAIGSYKTSQCPCLPAHGSSSCATLSNLVGSVTLLFLLRLSFLGNLGLNLISLAMPTVLTTLGYGPYLVFVLVIVRGSHKLFFNFSHQCSRHPISATDYGPGSDFYLGYNQYFFFRSSSLDYASRYDYVFLSNYQLLLGFPWPWL